MQFVTLYDRKNINIKLDQSKNKTNKSNSSKLIGYHPYCITAIQRVILLVIILLITT